MEKNLNTTIENFLANIKYLHELEADNLPNEVIKSLSKMTPEEVYKICTQFVVLRHNVPSKEKVLNISEDELLALVHEYGKKLLERIKNQ
jgi:hypothetical protein